GPVVQTETETDGPDGPDGPVLKLSVRPPHVLSRPAGLPHMPRSPSDADSRSDGPMSGSANATVSTPVRVPAWSTHSLKAAGRDATRTRRPPVRYCVDRTLCAHGEQPHDALHALRRGG